MTDRDRVRFAEILAVLAENYGPASAIRQQAWWMALADQPIVAIEAAALRLIQRRPRVLEGDAGRMQHLGWPTPAEILALIYDGNGQADHRDTRQAIAALPPASEADLEANRNRIKSLIRDTVASLGRDPDQPLVVADRQPTLHTPATRDAQLQTLVASPLSTSDVIVLADRAGYSRAEIAAAIEVRRPVAPPPDPPVEAPETPAECPWVA